MLFPLNIQDYVLVHWVGDSVVAIILICKLLPIVSSFAIIDILLFFDRLPVIS
jgi:hypothetical protein